MTRLLPAALTCALAAPAAAQDLDLVASLRGGSGLSTTSGDRGALRARSPASLQVDAAAILDGDTRWEWVLGGIAELEGRVSAGVVPEARRVVRGRTISGYGLIGTPAFLAPFTLAGARTGLGAFVRLGPGVALVLEATSDLYFWGSDLADNAVLAKFDVGLGVRLGP
jgi:hypothetical protein